MTDRSPADPVPGERPAPTYPFSAVVGQDALKRALILCAISPSIGGVLIRGEKGTAKSTIVRALAPLLPQHHSGSAGRVVELPIGATEDRVVGSLDVEKVLRDGDTSFRPGLLGTADGGVLYIDEVNLLADHVVDVLLDAAAMGRVTVERDSVSRSYASRFVLVGTMNPEEGELRPQLLDRFGLTVAVSAPRDVDDRVEVITRRMEHDADPASFAQRWRFEDAAIATSIESARASVGSVRLPRSEMRRIAAICTQLDVDGLRGDIVVARTACAHAAWRGAGEVDESDVRAAAELALPHRRRRDPFDDTDLSSADLDAAMADADRATRDEPTETPAAHGDGVDLPDDPTDPGPDDDPGAGSSAPGDPLPPAPRSEGLADDAGARPPGEQDARRRAENDADDEPARHDPIPVGTPPSNLSLAAGVSTKRALRVRGTGDGDPGRRSPALSSRGHTVAATTEFSGGGVHLHATVLAAAAGHVVRGGGRRLRVTPDDLRGSIRVGREGNLVVFVVDLSGSMTARNRLDAVSGACSALLRDSYQRRDRVAVVVLRGSTASVVVPPTRSVIIAMRGLSGVTTGGRTPLAEGLTEAAALVDRARHTDPRRRPLLVVLTDGRATSGPDAVSRATQAAGRLRSRGVDSVVVDCEQGMIRLGLARTLAGHLGGAHMAVEEITHHSVVGAVRSITGPTHAAA